MISIAYVILALALAYTAVRVFQSRRSAVFLIAALLIAAGVLGYTGLHQLGVWK